MCTYCCSNVKLERKELRFGALEAEWMFFGMRTSREKQVGELSTMPINHQSGEIMAVGQDLVQCRNRNLGVICMCSGYMCESEETSGQARAGE